MARPKGERGEVLNAPRFFCDAWRNRALARSVFRYLPRADELRHGAARELEGLPQVVGRTRQAQEAQACELKVVPWACRHIARSASSTSPRSRADARAAPKGMRSSFRSMRRAGCTTTCGSSSTA